MSFPVFHFSLHSPRRAIFSKKKFLKYLAVWKICCTFAAESHTLVVGKSNLKKCKIVLKGVKTKGYHFKKLGFSLEKTAIIREVTKKHFQKLKIKNV